MHSVLFYSTKPYEPPVFDAVKDQLELNYSEARLTEKTASLSAGHACVCCFVDDDISAPVIAALAEQGIKLIALRCAGFNNVDIEAAKKHNVTVVRVPDYSPHAVAEFALTLILTLNRKIVHAEHRIREQNFELNGLMGFDLHGKTVGVIGTGKIGAVFADVMLGLGCKVVAFDPVKNAECEQKGVQYVEFNALYAQSDIISLHCPLNDNTHHIINEQSIAQCKPGVMIINTGRGGLLDTKAVVEAVKAKHIGYLGMDVYEEEENLFFEDHGEAILQDDTFARLLTFPNVLVTGHQAFFTKEALNNIAETTVRNIAQFVAGNAVNTVTS